MAAPTPAADRIAAAPAVEELPGKRLALTIIIDDPWASEAKGWAEQAGIPVAEWLEGQIRHVFESGWFPVV